jgi:hypothetical protein
MRYRIAGKSKAKDSPGLQILRLTRNPYAQFMLGVPSTQEVDSSREEDRLGYT